MSINRLQAPQFTTSFSFPAIAPEQHILPNQLPLFVINAGSQALCKIEMVFNAGNYFETGALIANATNSLMREGTTSKSAGEIAELLDYYGAFLETAVYKDKASVILYSLNKHLSKTLPVMMDIIQNAIFPEKELSLYKTNQKQKFLVNQQKVDFVARNHFNALLFKDTPYDQFAEAENYDKLTQAQLQSFFKERYANHASYMVIAGNIATDVLNQGIDAAGSLPLKTESKLLPYVNAITGRQELFIEKKDAMQSAIRIGRRLFNKNHSDYFGMQLLNTILGGYFGSRLMSNIREDKGYTYGIYSSQSSYIHSGMLCIQTEVGRDVLQHAVDEIYKEMDLLLQESIEEEELLLVKNYLLGSIIGDLDGPFSILQRWRSLILNGLDQQTFQKNIHTYKNITAIELQQLAKKYYNAADFFEIQVV